MKQRHVRWQQVLTALALVGVSSVAAAQEQESTCETDADCEYGTSCEVTGGGAAPCPGSPPCDGDGDCPPPPECNDEPIEIRSCEPLKGCTANRDCAEDWVCVSQEERECNDTDAACSPETPEDECPKPEPAECQTETFTQCMPRWVAPCEDASSCGPGFACVERIIEMCSGGSAGDPGAGGAGGDDGEGAGFAPPPPQDAGVETDPVPPDDGCTQEGSGVSYCELQDVTCSVDSDCASGLKCQDSPVTSGCTRPSEPSDTPGSGGADGAGVDAGAADGDQPEGDRAAPEPCELPEPERVCAPEGYFEYGGGRGDADYDGVAGNDEGGGEGAPQTPTDGDDNNSGTGGPTSGMDPTEAEEGAAMEESSGCRTAGRAQSGSVALIALALAALVLRRKKLRA